MEKLSTIFVAGEATLLGAAIVRRLKYQNFSRLLSLSASAPDLRNAVEVEAFFARHRPDYVFVAGGKSGGIRSNQKFPATLMLDNLEVATHVISAAHRHGVKKLLYLGSSCCYPKHCAQPMRVESLLTGPLEPTNEAYALAKLAGLKLCEAYAREHHSPFMSGIVADIFGPGEDLDQEDLHVVPALILRMHLAKQLGVRVVEIWGSGSPRRECMFADDAADACFFAMNHYDGLAPINLGGGVDLSIKELAQLIQEIVGFDGELHFDTSKPDGMPMKILDSSKIKSMGWRPRTPLRDALRVTYEWIARSPAPTPTVSVHAR